jgi:hypothetical protein
MPFQKITSRPFSGLSVSNPFKSLPNRQNRKPGVASADRNHFTVEMVDAFAAT